MKRLKLLSFLTIPMLVMAACEQPTPTDPLQLSTRSFVTIPDAFKEIVVVCKVYSGTRADIFNFEGTNIDPAIGNTFTVARDACRRVALHGTGVTLTLTAREVNFPAGVQLDSVVVFQRIGDTVTRTRLLPGTGATASVLVGGQEGAVIVAFNSDIPTGCTRTLGYWKTHNATFGGGTPVDPTWNLITPSAEQSPFFLSGTTYFQVFWTSPAGNAYYQLAHQYIAAKLNVLAGASAPPAVSQAITDAETLFNTYTPAQIGALAKNSTLRGQFITLAGILGTFNEGEAVGGPDHCE